MLSISKNLGVSPSYVLYDLSYANAMLYSSATPLYDDETDVIDMDDETISANNSLGLKIEHGLPI